MTGCVDVGGGPAGIVLGLLDELGLGERFAALPHRPAGCALVLAAIPLWATRGIRDDVRSVDVGA